PVADVDVARRVRVHRQQVELAPRIVMEVGAIEPEVGPALLPARLDRGRVVTLDPGSLAGGRRRAGRDVGHVGLADERRPPAPAGGRDRRHWREKFGGAKGARTPDLLNAIQTLFQLSYSPAPDGKDSTDRARIQRRTPRIEAGSASDDAGVAT